MVNSLSLFHIILFNPPAPALFIFRSPAFFVLLLISCTTSFSQYRLDTWTTDNGLPQNSITGLTHY
jgi:hypothetical protein